MVDTPAKRVRTHGSTPTLQLSARYVAEDERTFVGDLLRTCHTQRSIATQLRRRPSMLSRRTFAATSAAPEVPAVRRAPQNPSAQPMSGFVAHNIELRATSCK